MVWVAGWLCTQPIKNSILGLHDGAKKTLKDIVEKEAEEQEQQE